MASERQREIASAGGRAAHRLDRAHKFTSEEAREAGRKGGSVVERSREYAAVGAKTALWTDRRGWMQSAKGLGSDRGGVAPSPVPCAGLKR